MATVALAKRDLLLGVHRFRLRREDLEDCFSQATLELVVHVRRGGRFADRLHLAHALELRFLSRARDRRRALAGRSPIQAAVEGAVPLSAPGEEDLEIADGRAEVEKLVMLRDDLQAISRLLPTLSDDQRRVLASQLSGESRESCCRRFGWSAEKYRKLAQRARARLRHLASTEQRPVPSASGASE